jgi:hypothetical protein
MHPGKIITDQTAHHDHTFGAEEFIQTRYSKRTRHNDRNGNALRRKTHMQERCPNEIKHLQLLSDAIPAENQTTLQSQMRRTCETKPLHLSLRFQN